MISNKTTTKTKLFFIRLYLCLLANADYKSVL